MPEDTFVNRSYAPIDTKTLSGIVGMPGSKYYYTAGNFTDVEIMNKYTESIIIGLPPVARREYMGTDADVTNRVLASMPICEIIPAIPKTANQGIKLYDIDTEAGILRWQTILKYLECPFDYSERSLYVAFMNEGPISEVWQNDYQDSMFENFPHAPFIKEGKFMTGKDSISGVMDEISKRFSPTMEGLSKGLNNPNMDEAGKGLIEKFLNMTGSIAGSALTGGSKAAGYIENMAKSSELGQTLLNVFSGSNIDFPLVWNTSTFMPQYSISIKLVNPFPVSNDAYEKYIIQPLIKILALVVPVSDSANTYTYPLICKVRCPGLFQIRAGAILSLEVVKGGDGNDIAFFQRPNTVDIRITFTDLYETMIHVNDENYEGANSDRPTLKNYINNLRGLTKHNDMYDVVDASVTTNENSVYSTSYNIGYEDRITSNVGGTQNSNRSSSRIDSERQAIMDSLGDIDGSLNSLHKNYTIQDYMDTNTYQSYDSIQSENPDYPE